MDYFDADTDETFDGDDFESAILSDEDIVEDAREVASFTFGEDLIDSYN